MAVAAAQPALLRQCCAVLSARLRQLQGGLALQKRLVDCVISLLARGVVAPVMEALGEVASSSAADFSLARHVALRLLAVVAPPYAPPFAASLLALLRQPRLKEAFGASFGEASQAAARQRQPLVETVRHIGAEHPPLKEGAAAWLFEMGVADTSE